MAADVSEIDQLWAEVLYVESTANSEISQLWAETLIVAANSDAEVMFFSTEVISIANSDAEIVKITIEVATANVSNDAFLYATISSNNVFYSSIELGDVATQKVSDMYVELLSNASAHYVYIPGAGWWYYTGNSWYYQGTTYGGNGGTYTGGGSWNFIDGVWVWINEYGDSSYYASLPQQLTDLNIEILSSNNLVTAEQSNFLYM